MSSRHSKRKREREKSAKRAHSSLERTFVEQFEFFCTRVHSCVFVLLIIIPSGADTMTQNQLSGATNLFQLCLLGSICKIEKLKVSGSLRCQEAQRIDKSFEFGTELRCKRVTSYVDHADISNWNSASFLGDIIWLLIGKNCKIYHSRP